MTMKASLIITARDQASGVFGRIAAKAKAMGAAFKPVAKEAGAADKAIDRIGRDAPSRFARIGAAAKKLAGTYGLKAIEKSAYGAGYGIGFLAKKGAAFAVQAAGWAAAGASAAGGFFFGGIFSQTGKMEVWQSELTRIERSSAKAKAGLSWLRGFANDSTIQLGDLTEAFVGARKAGIDPFSGAFAAMQDEAIASKRTLTDVVEAMRQAKIGDFGGLESLDIQAAKSKGRVLFSFLDKEGKRATRNVRDNADDIQKALTDIMTLKSGGANAAKAGTLFGMWDRFKNMVGNFQIDTGNAGVFDLIKAKAQGALSTIQTWAKDGTLKKWAELISQKLQLAFNWADKFIRETNWKNVTTDLSAVGQAVWGVVKALAFVVRLLGSIRALGNWSSGIDIGVGSWLRGKGMGGTANAYEWLNGVQQPKSGAKPAARTAPSVPMMKPMALPGGWKNQKVGGAIDLRIRTDPGVSARATKLSATNRDVPITVNTGKVSFG